MTLSVLILAATVVSNKVVFVDQEGMINAPEVVASVGDMAANKTAIKIAQAASESAEKAAIQGTNLINSTVQAIAENEFVVYRRGFTDSLGVMVVLPPDTKCLITRVTPNVATDGNGNAQHEIIYATTADASAVPPGIKHVSTLKRGEGRDQFTILDANIEKTNLATTFEDGKGTIYNYMYSVKFWLPVDSRGFFIVYLDADAADGDGMTFDVKGGITGGYTGDIVVGSDTLKYKGGLLMEIKSND